MERCHELEDLTRRLYEAVTTGDVLFFERHSVARRQLRGHRHGAGEWWDRYVDALESDPGANVDYALVASISWRARCGLTERGTSVGSADRPTFKLEASP